MLIRRLLTLLWLMILCMASASVQGQASRGGDHQLSVGFSAVDITPPIGFRMGGGYGEKISTGVHDPLYAKAMVMRQGSASFGIVLCDLLFEEANSLLANQASNRTPFLELVAAWRDIHAFRYANKYGTIKPMEVQAVRINHDTAIVTLPHEIFVELGIAIKSNWPFRNTAVVSLANDIDFYIPTRRAFEEGSYEVTTCPLQPGCGELLVRTAGELLDELNGSREKN